MTNFHVLVSYLKRRQWYPTGTSKSKRKLNEILLFSSQQTEREIQRLTIACSDNNISLFKNAFCWSMFL